jgi:hypothetical protein
MEELRKALYEIEGKGARKRIMKLATEYDRLAMGHDTFPQICFDLIIEILSTEELFNKPGMDVFLMNISTDTERLSKERKQKLLDTIQDSYSKYANLEFCWIAGDMLARYFDREHVIYVFDTLFNKSTSEGKEGIALGLDIIAKHSKRDPSIMKKIEKILNNSK